MTSVCKCPSKIRYGSYVEKPNICFENQSEDCMEVCSSLQPIFNEVGIPFTSESNPVQELDTVGCDFIIDDPLTFAEQTVDRIIYSDKCICKDASGSEIGSYGIRLQFPEECSQQLCKDNGLSQTTKALIGSTRFSAEESNGSGPTSAPTSSPVTEVPTSSPVTEVPTSAPVTEVPTSSPATEVPTSSPTSSPVDPQKTNLGLPNVSYEVAIGIWVFISIILLILVGGVSFAIYNANKQNKQAINSGTSHSATARAPSATARVPPKAPPNEIPKATPKATRG